MIEVKEISSSSFGLFNQLAQRDHEQIVMCQDNATGLKAIIAIHNTVLGPGLGGTRLWNYKTEAEAINDVLRLSRGMTYKASISGLNLGGAKAVIIGDAKQVKSEALFRKFGRFVENLSGKYITAEDVNTTTKDMEYVAMETDHVVGLPESMGGGGDPSPVTAYGTYMGMKASAKKAWGNDSLSGKTVAVQGIGKVGYHLLEYLHKEGAKLYISDINEEALKRAAEDFGAIVVNGDDLFELEVDIFAPCAMGAILNTENINRLKCQIIAGAANNQLADEVEHGKMLVDRGIYYAPDFLINAGGLINVYSEYIGYNRERAYGATEKIYDTTLDIYALAEEKGMTTQAAAIFMAEKRVNDMMLVKSTY
ncbi:MAG: Glu/Leu/Phe/Val dehydrogenase [Bacteroidetes bacterium]|nr:MAG: Glu/Leu/Phe/Val dehydrogenase [Bacteroidota bacterium]